VAQGESNRSDSKYLDKLKTLIADLREDLKAPDLPFVAGEIRQEGKDPINEQIAKLPEVVPFTGVATTEGLTLQDQAHFDMKSVLILGDRYAAAMRKVQKR
jgi:hypothetical protein